MRGYLSLLLIVMVTFATHAQKQLVILKREKPLLHLSPGDDFVYRLKGKKSIRHTFINNLADTAVVTHKDTVSIHTIDRIYFRQTKAYNKLGAVMVIAGAGYFLIDQINNVLVQGNSFHVDSDVGRSSAILVGGGLPLMLIRKKSERIHGRIRVMVVNPDSPFYRRELQHMF